MNELQIRRDFEDGIWKEYVTYFFESNAAGITLYKSKSMFTEPDEDNMTIITNGEELSNELTKLTKHSPDQYTLLYRDDIFKDKEFVPVGDGYSDLYAFMQRVLKQDEIDAAHDELEGEW